MDVPPSAVQHICDFYEQMTTFVQGLSESYPGDYYVTMFRLMLITEAIPKPMLVDKFVQYVLPYEHLIVSRNDTFFTEDRAANFGPSHDYGDHMNGDAGMRLSTVWKEMDETERNHMWDWFRLFMALARKYAASMGLTVASAVVHTSSK